jgi:hypothetical protein
MGRENERLFCAACRESNELVNWLIKLTHRISLINQSPTNKMNTRQNSLENNSISTKKFILICLIMGALFMIIFPSWTDESTWQDALKSYVPNVIFCMSLWKANEGLVAFLDRYISWFDRPILRFFISVLGTIVVTVLVINLLNMFFYWLYFDRTPLEYIQIVSPWDFIYTVLITGVISLFFHGRGFLIEWRASAIEIERLKQAKIAAQYETLKNQVNPHFLFNSLNVLSSLVYRDQDLAAKFIKQLSKVYRYVLDTRDKEVVSLQNEIDALESYIFLMKIRFGDNLQVSQNVTPQPNEQMVPLTLQMLLENAIKHNEISKAFPLKIEINRLKNGLISMKNDLQEKRQLEEKSGVGLANIEARFKYISDKKVEILKTKTTFEVHIPIVEMGA